LRRPPEPAPSLTDRTLRLTLLRDRKARHSRREEFPRGHRDDCVTVHMEFKGHFTGRFGHTKQARPGRVALPLPVAILPPTATARAAETRTPLDKLARAQWCWPAGRI